MVTTFRSFPVKKQYLDPRQAAVFTEAHQVGMKTDRIRTDITDMIFVFIFLVGFGFEYG